jgi:hypothetical protein
MEAQRRGGGWKLLCSMSLCDKMIVGPIPIRINKAGWEGWGRGGEGGGEESRRVFKIFTWIRTWAFQETPEKVCPCPSSAESRQCRCSTPRIIEWLYNILNSDAGSRIRIQKLQQKTVVKNLGQFSKNYWSLYPKKCHPDPQHWCRRMHSW